MKWYYIVSIMDKQEPDLKTRLIQGVLKKYNSKQWINEIYSYFDYEYKGYYYKNKEQLIQRDINIINKVIKQTHILPHDIQFKPSDTSKYIIIPDSEKSIQTINRVLNG